MRSDTATDVRQVIIDLTPPTFTVNPPADVTKPTPPYTATITGTAADDATGVAAVEWRLGSSGAFQAATGTTNWSADVALPGLGAHTVTLRARDNAGNVSPTQTCHGQRHRYHAPGAEHHHAPGGRDVYAGRERRDR